MNAKENYNKVAERLGYYQKLMKLYETLVSCGIAKNSVHFYEWPKVSSDYSMGELVVVRCNGVEIDRIDNRQEYARSCKYQAKHGKIVLNFTKSDLKKYIALMIKRANCKGFFEEYAEVEALKQKAFVPNESIVKNFRTW